MNKKLEMIRKSCYECRSSDDSRECVRRLHKFVQLAITASRGKAEEKKKIKCAREEIGTV